jgi:hypothetical protein
MLIEDNIRNGVVHLVAELRRDGENDRHEFKEQNLGYSFMKVS